ncbi:MAG TPA: hypothetical protein VGS27_10875 [Candidatus Sulfotelmatobacter sp.]|nr:hypothetical protein [Candidatus Sulfotelmatobacter sp.]
MTRFLLDMNVLIALIDPFSTTEPTPDFDQPARRHGPPVRSQKTAYCGFLVILDTQTQQVLRRDSWGRPILRSLAHKIRIARQSTARIVLP